MAGVNKFVVVYQDDTIRAVPETVVSKMYDLADCDYMEGVRDIYSVDERGRLVPVEVGKETRDPAFGTDEGSQVYYATAPVYAGEKIVSYVHYSDH